MSLQWERRGACWFSLCGQFFVSETHGAKTVFDAWRLSKPHATPIAGTPFTSPELAKAACEQENTDG